MAGRERCRSRAEAVVDDTRLFGGEVPAVRIEPTQDMPACGRPVTGAGGGAGSPGGPLSSGTRGVVIRDGVLAPRSVRRSTFYRPRRAGYW
jgi:hypothetical protein